MPPCIHNLFSFVSDLEDGEGYDHLDFRRPVNDLKPQYLSSESIKTDRSRNSSHHSKDSSKDISDTCSRPGETRDTCKSRDQPETVISDLSSDQDWTDSVLNSLEKLNSSGIGTRKCIYQPPDS